MSRRSPRPLSFALESLTETLVPPTPLARVQQIWEQAMGSTIATAGRPTAERDGVLTITCTDAVWAAELDLMSSELLERLNREIAGQSIHRLRCRVG